MTFVPVLLPSQVFEYIDREPAHRNDGDVAPTELRGEIQFRNVSFAYPSRPGQTVVKNLNLRVGAGETVALVGHSGGGKSSVVSAPMADPSSDA